MAFHARVAAGADRVVGRGGVALTLGELSPVVPDVVSAFAGVVPASVTAVVGIVSSARLCGADSMGVAGHLGWIHVRPLVDLLSRFRFYGVGSVAYGTTFDAA